MANFDFSGYATRVNIKCADGRTIKPNAFVDNDGTTVPLVWNHQHNQVDNVLGHALLKNRPDGVYAYCTLNETESGKAAKELVENGDISSLSIYANRLQQNGGDVVHGVIREVSLVLAGANPGAYIDSIMQHGEESENEAVIYNGETIVLAHSEEDIDNTSDNNNKLSHSDNNKEDKNMDNEKKSSDEKTVADVFNTFTDEQKEVVYALIGAAIQDAEKGDKDEDDEEEGDANMKHNVFDNDNNEDVLCHAELNAAISDGKRYGSLKEAVLAHGITNIDYLFPEAKTLNNTPEFISRPMDWVQKVMGAVHHTPFSRIKSVFADITAEDARAKGYIKGKLKKDEVFSLLKRTTTPTTIYKKQKLDRDDVVDITDIDVVAWMKSEMRMMLDEEIARAVLIGDGRLSSSDDKVNELNIRPISKDAELYTIQTVVKSGEADTEDVRAKKIIRAIIKSRKDYRGSGTPTFYTTEDVLTDMLLLEDANGRTIYDTPEKLASTLRVKEIVTIPVMEGVKGADDKDLVGIIVNLADYNVGADKGGAVNMFDDFDIDYNAQKYLIETRCSGALIKPYSAIAITLDTE